MKNILILLLVSGVIVNASFSKSGDIVTDNITGLQWQDNTDVSNYDKIKSLHNGIIYCESLSLGGYSDWRLPNINELLSLIDDSNYKPAISEVFDNIESSHYWSSTSDSNNYCYGWYVHFWNGIHHRSISTMSNRIICVRGGE